MSTQGRGAYKSRTSPSWNGTVRISYKARAYSDFLAENFERIQEGLTLFACKMDSTANTRTSAIGFGTALSGTQETIHHRQVPICNTDPLLKPICCFELIVANKPRHFESPRVAERRVSSLSIYQPNLKRMMPANARTINGSASQGRWRLYRLTSLGGSWFIGHEMFPKDRIAPA